MELYEMFRENFPFIVREEKTALNILSNENNIIIDKRDNNGKLIAVSVINQNTILMLCVNKEYRNQGIGTELLKKSEEIIKQNGYNEIIVGVGFDYLMPGIPTCIKPYEQELEKDNIYSNVNNYAVQFFIKYGYFHSWNDANCFDMRVNLSKQDLGENSIGDKINGITYRWANMEDLVKIKECTDDAYSDFTQYYMNEELYKEKSNQRVLIATNNNKVLGTLIVSIEIEGKNLGSVGCTAVSHEHRGKHIASNLVVLGTKYLQSIGLQNGYLGYTYSGLDKLYGYAGYKICVYYYMAKKEI